MGWQSSDLDNYVPPKPFPFIKREFEEWQEWAEDNPEANCFYCGKARDDHEMEHIFPKADRMVGICKLCFPDFRIGNFFSDLPVIQHTLSKYKRYADVLRWFQRNGYEMFEVAGMEGIHAYRFIDNVDRYYERILRNRQKPEGEQHEPMEPMFEDSTFIEIKNNGFVDIIIGIFY